MGGEKFRNEEMLDDVLQRVTLSEWVKKVYVPPAPEDDANIEFVSDVGEDEGEYFANLATDAIFDLDSQEHDEDNDIDMSQDPELQDLDRAKWRMQQAQKARKLIFGEPW